MAGRQFWRHWWWAVLAGGAASTGIVTASLLGPGGSAAPSSLVQPGVAAASSPDSSGAAQPGTVRASRPRARGPAAASPTVTSPRAGKPVAGLPPVPRQAKASLTRWGAGPGGVELTRVSGQLGRSAQAGGVRLYLAMRQACTRLTTAVKAAEAGPPIPEPTMEHLYVTALATLTAAASHCQAAISGIPSGEGATARVNHALMQQSMLELAAGARELYLATGQIRIVSSHP